EHELVRRGLERNLADDVTPVHLVGARVEVRDLADAVASGEHALPGRTRADAERRDEAYPGDHDTRHRPGRLRHRRGGVLLAVLPQGTVVLAGRPQGLRVLDQVPEDVLPV